MNALWLVFISGLVTALATGLGALPFVAAREPSPRWVARANALAAGLMLGASFGLVAEGTDLRAWETFGGVQLGVIFVLLTQRFLHGHDVWGGDERGAGARRAILMVVVMTSHSVAEGVAVGASFAGEATLAFVITGAIALHNIPEGIAISAVLRPQGASIAACAGWSIVSSLPQPMLAVPSYLFVDAFRPALPWALGFAAGAMVVMVLLELLPEAYESESRRVIAVTTSLTLVGMLVVQDWMG